MLAQNACKLFILFYLIVNCYGKFEAPEAVLEAFSPKGFRVSIPALEGIEFFAFHGNINKEILPHGFGEIFKELTQPTDDKVWSFYNPDLELKIGDVINYWTFVQYDKLGFRSDKKNWKVQRLSDITDTACKTSETLGGADKICSGDVVFEDLFTENGISSEKWVIEQYIPFSGPKYEFNYYEDNGDVLYLKNNLLTIKPKIDEPERRLIDFQSSCTRHNADECSQDKDRHSKTLHAISSARLSSKFKFRYGIIEVKAKLLAGDWMFPEILLEHVSSPNRVIYIAYSRGNLYLVNDQNQEIGGRVLYGGPTNFDNPSSWQSLLKSKTNNEPYSQNMHVYQLKWTEDELTLSVDGVEYGKYQFDVLKRFGLGSGDTGLYKIVVGVGVGGILDFPDNSRSGNLTKPWGDIDVVNIRKFYRSRNSWKSSWQDEAGALEIDYVKVTAL